jgi:hypothetical protein
LRNNFETAIRHLGNALSALRRSMKSDDATTLEKVHLLHSRLQELRHLEWRIVCGADVLIPSEEQGQAAPTPRFHRNGHLR